MARQVRLGSFNGACLNGFLGILDLLDCGASRPAVSYDANGNLTGDGTHTYAYDVDNRLTSANGQLYARFDSAIGPGIAYGYDANGLNQYSSVAGATPAMMRAAT